MRKSILIISLLFMGFTQLYAQRELRNPLIDSKEVIEKGVALHDGGKYKDAIVEYQKVPRSDTNYADVLHELILSYYKDSNFVAAEKYANEALSLYPAKKTDWYNLLADIYDDTKRTDLALNAYDTILAQNPYNYIAYFNKGITYLRATKFDDATLNFEKCLLIDPYYASAHYFLAQMALLKGNLVQAMMSFTTCLMVAPDNRYEKNAVSFLNSIAEMNTTITEYLQKYKPGKEDNFDDIQDILVSKVALDSKYKLKADLEDPIVRQLQVVVEKLEYNANDKGFWMQFYVPLFKTLWDNNQFEPMVFYSFSSVDLKKIKEYNQKEKKKIDVFSTAATNYLTELRESNELFYNKRSKTVEKLYIKDTKVSGKGAYAKNAKNEDVVTGPWEFYYDNGRIKSAGRFDAEGGRVGDWNYFYENGVPKEITTYANDMADGKSKVWFDNGLLFSTSTYQHDKKEGEETKYYFNGRLSSVVNYKDDNKEGIAKYYNDNGYLSTIQNYKNDKLDGQVIFYYANGKTSSVASYVNDLPVGVYKEYFKNGKVKTDGAFVDGKRNGVWTTYFIDGTTAQTESYNKGDYDGQNITYFKNGKVESKHLYKKGKAEGISQDFADDGIMFSETVFEKDRLRDIKFFDKKGAIISNTTSRRGDVTILFYDANGVKMSQGIYNKDGSVNGTFTHYFKSGKVSAVATYQNDLLNGKKTWYYPNGKISEEGTYKDGKAQGYFTNYYSNSQVSDEGWYVDHQKQGTFIYYNLLGDITSKIYYLNDDVSGISEYFNPGNKPSNDQYYDKGWFSKIKQFDSTGKTIMTTTLNKGEGKVRFNHFNGNPYFVSDYKYYKLNGSSIITNGDGSKRIQSYYKNGERDSIYTSWYPNGKTEMEGKYIDGDKDGIWKYYYFDGTLSETENYKDGKLEGADISYNEFGKVDKEYKYEDGNLNGATKYYGDNGQLMFVFYYKAGDIIGYSYEDKTGNLLQIIPLEKGAGTVDAYYKNGTKSAHMSFSEGVVDGERILYYSNGKEQVISTRINGLENGVQKRYYPDGKIMKEENFYYGQPQGSFKHYNEDGSLISDINFYLGDQNGDCKYYTHGKLTQTYFYYYGLLESVK
ncbi:MAG: tetratricopeptide repeat protein [Ginsengibacter sp.]